MKRKTTTAASKPAAKGATSSKTSAKTTTKKSAKKVTRTTTRTTTSKVSFELFAPDRQNVSVTGDFTSWDASGIALKKGRNGKWKADVRLKPGRYEYKFIVDNEWWTDPNNEQCVDNGLGSLNSIIDTVKA